MEKGIIKVGDIVTGRGVVIELGEKEECVLHGKTWYSNQTYGTLFKKGESPSANEDIDWGSMSQDVKITSESAYGNEMFNCKAEIL